MEGYLLIDKPEGRTSFSMVAELRRHTGQKKIGHAGTLDPFATGLLVLLLGKKWTTKASEFMGQDKEYRTTIRLGISTDSYDRDGTVTSISDYMPSLEMVQESISHFQGEILQVPPMFSAKKVAGTRLYEHARSGIEIERKPCLVHVVTELVEYTYPYLQLKINCSKGTYIRSIGHDIGLLLGCGGHLSELRRTKSGKLSVEKALDGSILSLAEISKNIQQEAIV